MNVETNVKLFNPGYVVCMQIDFNCLQSRSIFIMSIISLLLDSLL